MSGKIVLYGHFGSGNIGNDSSLQAALLNIRRLAPQAKLVCVCNGTDVIAGRWGIEAIPINPLAAMGAGEGPAPLAARILGKLRRLLREIRFVEGKSRWFAAEDMFVVVGTGAVDDMAVRRPWDAPLDLYKWCKAAKIARAKVVFLSVGVGPIVNPMSRRLMLAALRLADWRSYREKAAVEYLQQHGFDTGADRLSPDLVFSLPGTPQGVGSNADPGRRFRIGLGLINYRGWTHDERHGAPIFRDYMTKAKAFVVWLLARGWDVQLLVGDATDEPCVREIMAFMETEDMQRYSGRVHAKPIADVDDLLRHIAETDVVVASRFHNVLCALMLNRPVVSIGYHAKNDLLMASVGLADFCQRIESFSIERLIRQVDDCVARRAEIAVEIGGRVAEFRRSLDEQYDRLLQAWRPA